MFNLTYRKAFKKIHKVSLENRELKRNSVMAFSCFEPNLSIHFTILLIFKLKEMGFFSLSLHF